ncbi:hypothetical protein [Desulfosediminicola ganghwensis]|uniref:hypothetical protein n=1 Tax=Desulfosediminicola ganghwensis TaxID=2569540 RepID=UPI001593B951|nr:hypothetical protein [Desulfosediminicola ganghwensis]
MNIPILDFALICLLLPIIPVIGIMVGQYIHKLFGLHQDAQGNRPPTWQEEELVRVPADSSSCRVFRRRKPNMYN